MAELGPLLAGLERGAAVDIGFGEGESLEWLAELGYDPLYGYEIGSELVDSARARMQGRGAAVHLFAEDATPMREVADSSVVLVLVINALQYFHVPALAATVGRVLRPGGYLVACVPRPAYYVHPRHLLEVRPGKRPWWLVSYPRSALRSAIFSASGRLPLMGGATPEIGWSNRTLERFANLAGLEIVENRRTPASRRVMSLRRA